MGNTACGREHIKRRFQTKRDRLRPRRSFPTPAIGCPPTKCTPSHETRSAHATIAPFVLPTSVIIQPGEARLHHRGQLPPEYAQWANTKIPDRTALRHRPSHRIHSRCRSHRAHGPSRRVSARLIPIISRPIPSRLNANPNDPPINPTPTMAIAASVNGGIVHKNNLYYINRDTDSSRFAFGIETPSSR